MLAIPGLGPMVGESTLKAGLAGLGVDSAVGDVARALIQMGVPELEAKRYEDRLEGGAILLAMRCASDVISYVKVILKRTGAEDVCIAPAPAAETRSPVRARPTKRRAASVAIACDSHFRSSVTAGGFRRTFRAPPLLPFSGRPSGSACFSCAAF